ncbi:MAG: hypothetical protein FWE07_08640 [Turicibacter sp.]|nr:hypothetical protein [Turicibacter sp.]
MSLNDQFYLLIHTVLYGFFLGLLFDSLNLAITRFKKRVLRDISMVVFWVLQFPFAILYFHRISQGNFQSYLIIFVLLGGWLYFKTLSAVYFSQLRELKKRFMHVYRFIEKLINVLIFKPLLFIFKFFSAIILLPRILFKKQESDDSHEELV